MVWYEWPGNYGELQAAAAGTTGTGTAGGSRNVVTQHLPATWVKEDVVTFFSTHCGTDALERTTHIPKKQLALLTFTTPEAAAAAVAATEAEAAAAANGAAAAWARSGRSTGSSDCRGWNKLLMGHREGSLSLKSDGS